MRPGLPLVFAVLAAVTSASAVARAQEPPPPPSPENELDPDAGIPKPAAPDWRTGHFLLTGRFGMLSPTGDAAVVGTELQQQTIYVGDLARIGMVFGGTLGFGVSRHGVVEAAVDYGALGAPIGCTSCFGRQLAIALGVSYHLAQGVALDPWVSYGVGFRFSSFKVPDLSSTTIHTESYRGIDIARLGLGADFYPASFVGIGPYLEADIGTNVKFPHADYGGSVYAMFQLGVRLTFDPLRATTRSRRATAERPAGLLTGSDGAAGGPKPRALAGAQF